MCQRTTPTSVQNTSELEGMLMKGCALSEVCQRSTWSPCPQPVTCRWAVNAQNSKHVRWRKTGHCGRKLWEGICNAHFWMYRYSIPLCIATLLWMSERNWEPFFLLVFSTSGGMRTTATVVYKRIAARTAEKHRKPYSRTMDWVRCRLKFSLVRSAIMCLRGSCSALHALPCRSSHYYWLNGPCLFWGQDLKLSVNWRHRTKDSVNKLVCHTSCQSAHTIVPTINFMFP